MPVLDWIGKKAVVNHHRDVPYRLIHCDAELSAGEPDSENLLVQGDNLEALKALLPYYAGKVKCIYIDPPYNTGNEGWVYNDNVASPEIKAWLGKVVGKEAEDLSRHDKWLCMMYPRLRLLREFLREDGVIAVSVDEFEHRHLSLLMDELYGSNNRIETLIWKKSYGGGAKSKHIVNTHEYIEFFAKSKAHVSRLDLPPSPEILKYYKFEDSKVATRGPFRLQPLATNSMDDRPNLRYPLLYDGQEVWPDKQWQWSQARATKAQENDELVFDNRNGKWTVNYKQYLLNEHGIERGAKMQSIIEGVYTQAGTAALKDIFGEGKAFDFPKPYQLIEKILSMTTESDDLVLDSFGGSGSTGHAVLNLNKKDGARRRFILVEMDEMIAPEITAERLRRVISGYDKNGDANNRVEGLGGGFRYCKLGTPLFNEFGDISEDVSFPDLAAHIFFSETGAPLPKKVDGSTPYIGSHRDKVVYLLFVASEQGFPREAAGNVLTPDALDALPTPPADFDGIRIVYAEGCTVSAERLKSEAVIFKQIPYQIDGG